MKFCHAHIIAFTLALLMFGAALPAFAAGMQRTGYSWKNAAIGGGGYVLDVYCSPKQKDLVYIRTDVGGFYRWNPAKLSWTPILNQFGPSQSNYYGGEGMAVDPSDARIVYAAAGKYTWDTPGTIFKSYDEGHTWHKLPIDLEMGGNMDHRWGGQRLVVSPFHARVLLFGSRLDGLWRSDDAGASWSNVASFPKPANANGITSIAFSNKTPGVVYAAGFGVGVYESLDDGQTWRLTAGGPTQVERLAASPDGSVYATNSDGVAKYLASAWGDVTPKGAGFSFGGVSVDPTDPNDVIVTGQTDHLRLFRSRDAGATWTEKSYTVHSSVPWYSDQMKQIQSVAGLAFDPCVPGRFWLTDWYATYMTPNIDADPIALSNHEHGHEELVVFTMAATPTGPPLLSGVADVDGFVHTSLDEFPDRGLGSYYHGSGPSFGDTDQIAWCASAPDRVARVGVKRWDNTGGGATSTDGGLTWTAFAGWNPKLMPARIAIDPANPSVMVVECIKPSTPMYTSDGGVTWTPVSGLPGGAIDSVWNWSTPLAADGVDAGVFYAVSGGQLCRSSNRGATFAPVGGTLPAGDQTILESVPGKSGELWLALGSAGLFESTDGGQTLSKVTTVASADLFAVGKSDALYLEGKTSDGASGIFRSLDSGRAWQEIDDPAHPIGDVPNSMTASFKTFGLVFIGTNGHGIYYGKPSGQ